MIFVKKKVFSERKTKEIFVKEKKISLLRATNYEIIQNLRRILRIFFKLSLLLFLSVFLLNWVILSYQVFEYFAYLTKH